VKFYYSDISGSQFSISLEKVVQNLIPWSKCGQKNEIQYGDRCRLEFTSGFDFGDVISKSDELLLQLTKCSANRVIEFTAFSCFSMRPSTNNNPISGTQYSIHLQNLVEKSYFMAKIAYGEKMKSNVAATSCLEFTSSGGFGHVCSWVGILHLSLEFGVNPIVLALVVAFRLFSNMAVVRHIVFLFLNFWLPMKSSAVVRWRWSNFVSIECFAV